MTKSVLMSVLAPAILEMKKTIEDAELELSGLKAGLKSMQRRCDAEGSNQETQVSFSGPEKITEALLKDIIRNEPIAPKRPTLANKVLSLLPLLKKSPFTVSHVATALGTENKNRVSTILKSLSDGGVIEVIVRGEGRRPNVYKVISP